MTEREFDSTVVVGAKPAERASWSVIVVTGERAITHSLPSDGEVTIGRFTGSTVIINHGTLSRLHAMLHIDGANVTIEDLGSANGTFVREAPVAPGKRVPVNIGDVIRLGSVILILRCAP